MILLQLIFLLSFAAEDTKTYSKAPKSLFLIKKAKVEADVGEPLIPLFDKQKQTVLNDKRFNIYDN